MAIGIRETFTERICTVSASVYGSGKCSILYIILYPICGNVFMYSVNKNMGTCHVSLFAFLMWQFASLRGR